ncbi:hypothetical protein BAE44_0018082, partial [Dichanthelium oligosanthes]
LLSFTQNEPFDTDKYDFAVTNAITGMDKGGGCGSNRKCDGAKASNTVPWSKDLNIVQALPGTQRPPLDKRNLQKLPARQCTPSKNTKPPKKPPSLLRQQVRQPDLPAARQEPALQQTNMRRTQEQGSQVPPVPRIRIKIKQPSTAYAPRRLCEKTLEKKRCEENQGVVITVTRNPPIDVAAGDLPSSGQVIKTGMPTQSSAGPEVGAGKRKEQLAYMDLDETKRKLHGAYQEAENAKKKRAIQVVKLCDIPTLAKSMKPISRTTTPLTKSMNDISKTPSIKQKSHIIRSREHDRMVIKEHN